MGYNRENYARIMRGLETRRSAAIERSDLRGREITEKVPGIKEIDARLSDLGLSFFGASKEGADALRREIQSLRKERGLILEKYGYAADYDRPEFGCPVCSDTGWVGIDMCECVKRELRRAEYESSGIGRLSELCTFDTFDLRYYESSAEAMKNNAVVLGYLKKYAAGFSGESDSILLMGGPGVGKTHLAVSTAGAVLDGGHEAVFVTAGGMISDFEYEQFRRGSDTATPSKTEKYLERGFLVIDDLGTEFGTEFTSSCVYNVINTRMNAGLPTFITTNLTNESIKSRYGLRVYSRLFNEYRVIRLMGGDVRGAIHG